MEKQTHSKQRVNYISKYVNWYHRHKKDEHHIFIDNTTLPLSVFVHMEDEIKENLYKPAQLKEKSFSIVSQSFIDKLSPDNINSSKFWKHVIKKFPINAVCGNNQANNINEANRANFFVHNYRGHIYVINQLLKGNQNLKILEIGPGYGCVKNYIFSIASKKQRENYYAIDVNPLFKYNKLFKTNGKDIPTQIPNNLSLVISFNVFQHLSKSQRSSYYRQVYEKLKPGGYFNFDMFTVTPENKDSPNLWGYRNEEDKRYCFLFRQLTEVDPIEETINELKQVGFRDILPSVIKDTNYGQFLCVK